MVGMADRHRKRVGGVSLADRKPWQKPAHHYLDLRLVGVAGADDGLFDQVRRVFGDREPAFGWRQQDHTAGDAKLQGRGCVAIHKTLFDRRLVRAKAFENSANLAEQRHQPHGKRLAGGRMSNAVADMRQPIAVDIDDPPTGVPQTGIEPQNAHPV